MDGSYTRRKTIWFAMVESSAQIFGAPKWKPWIEKFGNRKTDRCLGRIGKQILNIQSFRINLRFGMLGSSLRSVWTLQIVRWRPVAEACGSTCRWSRPFCWCALSGLSSSAEGPRKWSANRSRGNRSRWSHYLQRWKKNYGRKRTK